MPPPRIIVEDFEFTTDRAGRPVPRCVVSLNLDSGEVIRRRLGGDPSQPSKPSFELGADDVYVAYYASAEMNCCLVLGWPLPPRVLDLYAEFRCLTAGLSVGRSLLNALTYFQLPAMTSLRKEQMRGLAMRHTADYTENEWEGLLDYCQEDVEATARLFTKMKEECKWNLGR